MRGWREGSFLARELVSNCARVLMTSKGCRQTRDKQDDCAAKCIANERCSRSVRAGVSSDRGHLRCHSGKESSAGAGSEVDRGAGNRAGDEVGQDAADVCVKRDVPEQSVTIMQ